METIPENVVWALLAIRSGGLVNMLDRMAVAELVEEFDTNAARWLRDHKVGYAAALETMSKRIDQTDLNKD